MSRLARLARVAVAVALAGSSVLAVPPTSAVPRPPRSEAPRAAHAGRTRVVVVVRSCPECTVQAVRYVPDEGGDPWSSRRHRVDAHGEVELDVPSDRTRGMTFIVDAPWHGADGVAAVVAARYAGREVGERVSPAQAARARRGGACWSGTAEPRARIVVRVARFRSRTLTGGATWHPRAWAVHTLPSSPPMSRAPHGSLGTQYAIGCSPPAAAPRRHRRAGTTQLTLRVPRCAGCQVTLGQWLDRTRAPWRSATREVRGGRVRYAVRSSRTHGMFVALTAPWEGVTGYQTFVVFRYGDHRPGERVGFATARHQTLGSACWAGTTARRRTLAVAAREVGVLAPMSGQRVRGTIAWVPSQQRTWLPDRPVRAGVLGSEEAIGCDPPAPRQAR